MTREQTKTIILEALNEALNEDYTEDEIDEEDWFDDLGADSLDQREIIRQIEDSLDIEIFDDQIGNCENIKEFIDAVFELVPKET